MLDFFNPIVPRERLHKNFIAMTLPGHAESERATFQEWATGMPDRDGKLVHEFQTTFNSTFWEVYVNACHREIGWDVDYSFASPDFVCRDLKLPVGEATTTGAADGYAPEWQFDPSAAGSLDIAKLNYTATIRLSNSVCAKAKKYRETYSRLDHVKGRPFALWLAPFEQPMHFLQGVTPILRVLYGVDTPATTKEGLSAPFMLGPGFADAIYKDSGAEIPLGVFLDTETSGLSAVVFSSLATFGKLRAVSPGPRTNIKVMALRLDEECHEPKQTMCEVDDYEESLLDGLHVFLNPNAANPLDTTHLSKQGIATWTFDAESGELLGNVPDGYLLHRLVISVLPEGTDTDEVIRLATPDPHLKTTPTPPAFADDELVPVPGDIYTFANTHLAHVDGWTILAAQDQVDGDWLWIAKKGLFHLVGDFRNASPQNGHELVHDYSNGELPTKEGAFTAARAAIFDASNRQLPDRA